MGSFEYNRIRVDAVESVKLIPPENGAYTEFKHDIYDSGNEIPEARQRLFRDPRSDLFRRLVQAILKTDGEQFVRDHLKVRARLPNYVENPEEVKEAVRLQNDEIDVEINPTPSTRGECRYSKDDDYRPENDDAKVCWKCSSDDTRKPEKFLSDDDPVETCTKHTANGYKIKRKLAEHVEWSSAGGFLLGQFRESDLSVSNIRRRLLRSDDRRSQAVNLAFKLAFPEEDYYYQRAEALLRDLDADVAQESSPGTGGMEFERNAIERLDRKFELRDEKVFKITFDDDAPPVAWRDFVDDPSEPTYKEADAIIEGDVGPIVVDFFTQRSTREKRKQVRNYAELYEKATGIEARAWGITDDARGELLELDTLVGETDGGSDEPSDGQAGLSDFL